MSKESNVSNLSKSGEETDPDSAIGVETRVETDDREAVALPEFRVLVVAVEADEATETT